MKRYLVYLTFLTTLLGSCLTAQARVMVCQHGVCDWTEAVNPWMLQLAKLFKEPNLRIDFCQADQGSRSCISEGINWDAFSPSTPISFSIPVARALPGRKSLMFDYLLLANESIPKCTFSETSLDISPNQEVRLASQLAQCTLSEGFTMHIQETFLLDYLDFDAAVFGGHYSIQSSDMVQSAANGYALLKLRDGTTSKPLVAKPYYSPDPRLRNNIYYTPDGRRFVDGQYQPEGAGDWWTELKKDAAANWESMKVTFNMDMTEKEKEAAREANPTFWNRFTDTFMKVIYFEPLN